MNTLHHTVATGAGPVRHQSVGAPSVTVARSAGPRDTSPRITRPTASLALILVVAFMVVLDFSIVNVALASIERELHAGATAVQWVITAYAITFGGLLVLGGRMGDLWGRRRMFATGLVVFSLASLAGGLAGNLAMLIAARALQGVGGPSWRRRLCRSSPRACPRATPAPALSATTAPRRRSGSSPVSSSAASWSSSSTGVRCCGSTYPSAWRRPSSRRCSSPLRPRRTIDTGSTSPERCS